MNEEIAAGLSPRNRAALFAALEPAEVLAWAAEPSAGMRGAGFATWLVGLPLVLFAALWLAMIALPALLGAAPLRWVAVVAALFGLVFMAAGIALVRKQFQMRRVALATVYALTDRRLIELRSDGKRQLAGFPVDAIEGAEVSEYSDGSGVIDVRIRIADAPAGMATLRIMGVQRVAAAHAAILQRDGRVETSA